MAVVCTALLTACPHVSLVRPTSGAGGTAPQVATAAGVASLSARYSVRGTVHFTTGRTVQSTMTEIADGSTVSLIRSDTGVSVSSSVTDANGNFILNFGNTFAPDPTMYYVLEAVKGLSAGGSPNRAGASAARVRTFLQWDTSLSEWTSITNAPTGPTATQSIAVTPTTTTVCAIVSLLQNAGLGGSLNLSQLIGSIVLGNGVPDTFTPGTSGLTLTQYNQLLPMEAEIIAVDEDPIGQIAYNSTTGNFSTLTAPVAITGYSPASAYLGDTVTISGMNFIVSNPGEDKVFFNGVEAATPSVNATGTTLTCIVPLGALSGPLTVSIGGAAFTAGAFYVESWDGHRPFDSQGNMYLASYANGAVFKLTPGGQLTAFATGLAGPRGVTVGPNDTVYVSDYDGNTITAITSGGASSSYATGGGLSNPWGLALLRNGTLLVANYGGNDVLQVAPGGGTPTAYYSGAGLSGPAGLALDPAGDLFVSNHSSTTVADIATGSLALSTPITTTTNPAGLAFDSTGNLYVADFGNNAVDKYSTTGALTTYESAVGTHEGPWDLAFDPYGNLYVGNWTSHTLYDVNPEGGIRDVLLAPITPYGITADANHNLFITVRDGMRRWAQRPRDTRVYEVPYNGGSYGPFQVALDGFSEPSAAAFLDGQMYVADAGTSRIYTANPTTGARQIWMSSFSGQGTNFSQMAFDPGGNLWVAPWQGVPYEIATGSQNITPYYSGQSFYGAVYDSSGNLYLTDNTDGYLLKVDTSGNTSVIARGLSQPAGIALDSSNSTLLVAEMGANNISVYSESGALSSTLSVTGVSLSQPSGLAINGSTLYIADWGDGNVYSVPVGGGPATLVNTTVTGANLRDICVTGGNAYVTNGSGQNILQIPLPSGVANSSWCTLPQTSAEGMLADPWGLDTDGTYLYVGHGSSGIYPYEGGASGLFRIPLTTPGSFTQIASFAGSVGTNPEGMQISKVLMTPGGNVTAVSYGANGLNGQIAATTTTGGAPLGYTGGTVWQSSGVAYDGTGMLLSSYFGRKWNYLDRLSLSGTSWTHDANLGATVGGDQGVTWPIFADPTSGNVWVGSSGVSGGYNGLTEYSQIGSVQHNYSGTGECTGVVEDPNGNLIGVSANSAIHSVPLFMIPSGSGTAATVMLNWPYRPGF